LFFKFALNKQFNDGEYLYGMQTVIGVGLSIPSKEEDFLSFDSNGSLSDADVAIFDPSFADLTRYHLDYPNGTFQGKKLYNIDSSFKIKEHLTHWYNEINSLLKAGKCVFIVLTEKILWKIRGWHRK
jgi:hypothetical protein